MTTRAEFTYMQARCQARFSLQLRGGWQRLSAVRDANAFLAVVLRKPLHASLSALSANHGVHEIEGLLRSVYRRMVDEVAAWVPPKWRAAVEWIALLADLPAIQFVRQGGDPYAWMRTDRNLAAFLRNSSPQAAACREAGNFSKLIAHTSSTDPVTDVWVRSWHTLWPTMDGELRAQLLDLQAMVLRSRQNLANAKLENSQVEAAGLEREFIRVFRQQLQTPAAAFAYLGLSWLELARIRAGLLERRLIAPPS